jgi:molybdenum cofactor synthesis domain-containing protein
MSYTAAVITVSDKGFRGERPDTSGPAICGMLACEGYDVIHTAIVPDEQDQIRAELIKCADDLRCALILTTGGTGFSPRDVTPEATLSAVEKVVPGIPEAMRAESMKITPHGCLSRETAGIRGSSLIINLPGSEKAVRENLAAVLKPIAHGLDMLYSKGSSDHGHHHHHDHEHGHSQAPSLDAWLREAKQDRDAAKVGMYLTHNGVVRRTARAVVREGAEDRAPVTGMRFSYDAEKADAAAEKARRMEGVYYVRYWLNSGELKLGDDIMFVLIGGDTRPHTIAALQQLVGELKNDCVSETEII